MADAAVSIKDLEFSYNGTPVLQEINLSIEKGEFVGIIGPNGGGKTTLLKLILGQLQPSRGSIAVLGKKPVKSRSQLGYMPQFSTVNTALPLTVAEIVAMGLFEVSHFFPLITKKKRWRIDEVLEKLGILSLASEYYSELSGGQKQRTMLARALISSPEILLLDEPTASVDYNAEKDIYQYLKQLSRNITVILVSHDVGVVSTLVEKVICLNRKAAVSRIEELTSEKIGRDLYNTDVDLLHHSCNL